MVPLRAEERDDPSTEVYLLEQSHVIPQVAQTFAERTMHSQTLISDCLSRGVDLSVRQSTYVPFYVL